MTDHVLATRANALHGLLEQLEQTVRERNWRESEDRARELLGQVSKILNRIQAVIVKFSERTELFTNWGSKPPRALRPASSSRITGVRDFFSSASSPSMWPP